jgi:hypothetical protein
MPKAKSLLFEPGSTGLERIYRREPVGGKTPGSFAPSDFCLNQDVPGLERIYRRDPVGGKTLESFAPPRIFV